MIEIWFILGRLLGGRREMDRERERTGERERWR
jgi:hypothetical protein